MANDHPFQQLFENLGRIPTFHADSVNRRAFEVLSETLDVPLEQSGRCIMLRAPRAGHGKTHLLSRIQRQLGATHDFIPLHAPFGSRIDAASVITDTLRSLARQLPASGGLCALDLVARRLFSLALQPLVKSGEVPCQDREGALTALRTRPVETFDFHHPTAVTAHWARDNFEVLGQRLSLELASRSGATVREVGYWVKLLFRFSSASLENPNRMEIMAEAVQGDSGTEMERLVTLVGLLALLKRVVLVADDLEVFSADESAALRLAALLGSLRQSVDRLDVVLSVNQDIWESAFVPRLSGGMADRLSEVIVELEPLQEEEMAALLDSRIPGLGSRVLERVDRGVSGSYARGLIRAAGLEWLKATAMDSVPPETDASSVELPPVAVPMPAAEPVQPFEHAQPPSQAKAVAPAEMFAPATHEPLPALEQTIVLDAGPLAEPQRRIEIPPVRVKPVETTTTSTLSPPAETTVRFGVPFAVPAPRPDPKPAPMAPPQNPAPAPAVEPPAPPAAKEVAAPVPPSEPEAPESSRVDELLRQFRDRYGRGSL